MKYLLIVNPISGSGPNHAKIDLVVQYFRRHELDIDVMETEYPGHAMKIAREACDRDYDVVIGAGGDGTINEVLNGIVGSRVKLGIIPWGTGNVFTTEMGFPRSLRAVCRLIRKGKSMRLDLGRCGERYFLLMIGAGLDAYSLKQLDGQELKKRLGMAAYAVAAFRAFTKYKFPNIRVDFPDGSSDHGSFVLISNTSRYGTFFSFTPNASPIDGYLDVFVFRKRGTLRTILLAIQYLIIFMNRPRKRVLPRALGQHGVYRTREVKISSEATVHLQVDGEFYGALPQSIEVAPEAVDIILPPGRLRRYMRKA